jgi:MFS family permease
VLPSALRPLRSRNFALLWSAALVSNAGSWVQAVALGILVTARTHNPLWTGLVAAAAFLPNGLLAPIGGALADRLDRRRWLVITTFGETACATLLAVLAAQGQATPAVAVALAFFGGCAGAVGFPAYQAMLPDLVDRDDLLAAVSLSSAQFNLGRVIGPALAGILIVAGNYSLAFTVNAISFGAVLVALTLLKVPRPERTAGPPAIVRHVIEGARLALGQPACRSAIGLIGLVALFASPFIALVPAMAIEGLGLHSGHSGAAGTSALVTAQGIGAVIGALTLPGLARRVGRGRQAVAALFLLPLVLVFYALAPIVPVAVIAIFLLGASYIAVLSGLNTVVQLRAPTEARGRVLSFFMLALGTLYPIGAVAQGAIARVVGVRTVTAGSALCLLAVLALVAVTRPRILGALTVEPEVVGPEVAVLTDGNTVPRPPPAEI